MDLMQQIVNISKAGAYDVVSQQRNELLEENARLIKMLKQYYKQSMFADTTNDYFESHWKEFCKRSNISSL